MRSLLLLAALAAPLAAQSTLYVCAAFTKEYVAGAKLPPSGLFRREADGEWRRTGFSHPLLFALDSDPLDPATLYLMAQLYPNEGPQTWYTGKSSEVNLEEARQWIESWVHLTTARGQGEYDSPHYMGVYLLPMSYLAAWAKDPAMKRRAAMMLDYADQRGRPVRHGILNAGVADEPGRTAD